MPVFACYPNDAAGAPDLRSAYLVGVDGVPVRGDIRFADGVIHCDARNSEALGLSLLWPVDGFGRIQLETTRLPARDEPYNLHVELARHRLMRISVKREEWGLFDYPGMEEIAGRIDHARDCFVRALAALPDGPAAARFADEALAASVQASEQMCGFHAALFLARRGAAGTLGRSPLGAAVLPEMADRVIDRQLTRALDFVRVPFIWRSVQPEEREINFSAVDACLKRCAAAGLAVRGGPLLNFGVQFVPDWMHIWESDYEAIAAFSREHVRRTVQRYAGQIQSWIVASGLHADNVFPFNFEQIMDLTRMAVSTARQAAPRAQIILDVVQPWGEYYARNQRSIPPMLYAEMAIQSGIPFDAFGLQFVFGVDSEGFQARDFLQLSSLLDRIAGLGRPIHLTAVAVPSAPQPGGYWHGEWSESVQAEWLATITEIALSKHFVESVCLCGLTDAMCAGVPSGGIFNNDFTPKPALERLTSWRKTRGVESKA